MKKVLLSCIALAAGAAMAMAQEVPEFPTHLDVTINGEAKFPGIEINEGQPSGEGSLLINIKGTTDAKEVTVTFATPKGWDGLMIMDFWEEGVISTVETRSEDEESIWLTKEQYSNMDYYDGNSVTYKITGDSQEGGIALVKDGMVYYKAIQYSFSVKNGAGDEPGNDEPVGDPIFPESVGVTIYAEGVYDEQHNEDGQIFINVYGESQESTFDVILDVPEGWTGFMSMPDSDDVTIDDAIGGNINDDGPRMRKVQEAEWQPIVDVLDDGIFLGNKFTFTANATRQLVEVHLYKDDMVDVANFIYLIANVKFDIAANQAAYEEAIAKINALQGKYEEAVDKVKGIDPDFDFSEWDEMVSQQIEEARQMAEWALADANEESEPFSNYYYGGTLTVEYTISQMLMIVDPAPEFPSTFDVTLSSDLGVEYTANDNLGVFLINVEGKSPKEEISITVAVPAGFDGFVHMSDVDAFDPGIMPFTTRAEEPDWVPLSIILDEGFKEGNTMTLPVDGDPHSGQFFLCKNGLVDMNNHINVESEVEYYDITPINQAAYKEVVAKIQDVLKEFDAAYDNAQKEYPDYDFSEWKEMIAGELDQILNSAAQGLESANEDRDEFKFAFDGEYYEGMIAEMMKAPIVSGNYEAYDKIMADIKAEYAEALEFVKKYNPEYDATDMMGKIEESISEAEIEAEEALNYANENGEKFSFSTTKTEVLIAEMKSQAVAEPNQIAYAEVVAKIDAIEKEYNVTLTELKAKYPDYDFTEWEEIIGGKLDETKAGAEMALKSANEDGDAFQFAFDGKDIEDMIEEMRNDVKTNGIGSVTAADNVTYYDLNGNKINNPKAGMYIKVVDGKSTKVVIK